MVHLNRSQNNQTSSFISKKALLQIIYVPRKIRESLVISVETIYKHDHIEDSCL